MGEKSKGGEKTDKKKPAKTLKEKRMEKREKTKTGIQTTVQS